MKKSNVIIIACSIVITVISVCFFFAYPKREVTTAQSADISEDMYIVSTSEQTPKTQKIEIENPEENKEQSKQVSRKTDETITASEYMNFEKTIDTLMKYTWEE